MPKVASEIPKALKFLVTHGVEVPPADGQENVYCDCPWCGKEKKFSVKVADGRWNCKVCHAAGNDITFLRTLHEHSAERNPDLGELAAHRSLDVAELQAWGITRSLITGDWLVPGYNAAGKLTQLYRYAEDYQTRKYKLWPTPEMGHGIHGAFPVDEQASTVILMEGPWDGACLRGMLRQVKRDQAGRLVLTSNPDVSLAADITVLAAPGSWGIHDAWLPLFTGKTVWLMYDSDHPKRTCAGCNKAHSVYVEACPHCGDTQVVGEVIPPAGFDGMRLVAQKLAGVAGSIKWLAWGAEGHDPNLPSGYDVRDCLTQCETLSARVAALDGLLGLLTDQLPPAWLESRRSQGKDVGTVRCDDHTEVHLAWRKAAKMRQSITDTIDVCLAVCISTSQVGDQIFLQMIAAPGSLKTRICDGLLASHHCYALEHLTGFHSGWKDQEGKDFSLISRINHKTLITPEGDVLMSSPRFAEIMSQQRRIFDGTSGATYKNRDEDLRYTGLRTPWIIAGTPALMHTDQARLGDRFLRVFLEPPTEEDKQDILRRVGYTALSSVLITSNGTAETTVEPKMAHAYRLTGGYVNHLRDNASDLLAAVQVDEEYVVGRCATLAEFTALLRARPESVKTDGETEGAAELPTRLTSQYIRLAVCLAAVKQRREVDAEVLRVVQKVALDTARGRTLEILKHLHAAGDGGLMVVTLIHHTLQEETAERRMLKFMKKLGIVEEFIPTLGPTKQRPRWRLTQRMQNLYAEVMGV